MGGIDVLFPRVCHGCEDISLVGNYLYTGHDDGRMLRFVEQEGLARVDLRAKTYEIVVHSFNDSMFQLIDYLDVAASGNVYFTDASDKFSDDDLQYDVLESRPHGALYRYNVADGSTERLVDDLYFANGVVVDPAEGYVLFAETAGFRVRKHWRFPRQKTLAGRS